MASDLKKVGLVFNSDGSANFVKSLKNVSASLQENYQDFQLVKSQYDENTKTSQKLADKLTYLNNAYDIQKNKVSLLSEELKEMEESENADEVAITKKRTALKAAEGQLNRYKSQIQDVSKELESGTANLKDFSQKVEDTGQKITDVGKKASLLSAGVIAVGTASKKAFDKVDEGADNVIKATGAIGEQAEDLEKSYKNVAQSIVGDFSSIGSGLGEVNTRFGYTGKELEKCTEKFIKFAEINGTDITTSVQLVSRAMGDAGIDANEYSTVLDALTVASQASGISIDSLTGNITKYGAPMRALGYTTQESIAIFASWEKAGVNTEIAFSGMKKAISNFASAGKDAKVEFKKTLEEIKACPDIAQATTKAIEVFGTKAGPDLADAIKGGRFEFNEMLQLIESSKGTVDNTFNGLLDGSYDADLAIQNAELALSSLGEEIMKSLAPVLEIASKKIQEFSDWFDNLDEGTKSTISTVAFLIGIIGPTLMILGSVIDGASKVIGLLSKLSGVLKICKLAISGVSAVLSFLAANPIVLIIAAVAALVAGLVYLWNTNESFRNAIIGIWDGIKNIFMQFNDFLQGIFATDWTNSFGIFGNVINGFVANISNFYNAICQIFQGIIDFVKGVFTGNWSLAWEGIKNIFGGVFNGLLAIAKIPLNGIIGMLNIVLDAINFLIKGLNKIKFHVPNWVPAIGGKQFGFNLKALNKIPYMANGGTLLNGAAIVAEAGPELLLQQGSKTKVVPLNSKAKNTNADTTNNYSKDNNINFNPTVNINNYSKYIGPADTARQSRNELKKLILQLKRG